MLRHQQDPQYVFGMTWNTVQSENIQIRIGGNLVTAYLETPTDVTVMENWTSREPIVLQVVTANELRLLSFRGMEVYLREHATNTDTRELRFIFTCRLSTGERESSEDLPDRILPFTCTQTGNLNSTLWIVRPHTPEQHHRNLRLRQCAIAKYEADLAAEESANRATIPTPKLVVKQPPTQNYPTVRVPVVEPTVKAPPVTVKAPPCPEKAKAPPVNGVPIDERSEAQAAIQENVVRRHQPCQQTSQRLHQPWLLY